MNTPEIDPKLQETVRKHLADNDWPQLAETLGVTLKSIQYQLGPKSPRKVTYHFIGLLAVLFPAAWKNIMYEYFGTQVIMVEDANPDQDSHDYKER
jgi:hypothetical protein